MNIFLYKYIDGLSMPIFLLQKDKYFVSHFHLPLENTFELGYPMQLTNADS